MLKQLGIPGEQAANLVARAVEYTSEAAGTQEIRDGQRGLGSGLREGIHRDGGCGLGEEREFASPRPLRPDDYVGQGMVVVTTSG
ncbi:MAG: hypothetical protein MZV70_43315 [Desulfobacterales bacterium]|nr:hypothetical protein [Desulfobacterales bacterium]